MTENAFDKIHIRDLHLRCIIGIFPDERRERQDISIDVTLYTDLRAAGRSDRIEDTVDYKNIKKEIVDMVENSTYYLIEKLAQEVADVVLEHEGVARVLITVDKPGALRFAQSVAVEITRDRASG